MPKDVNDRLSRIKRTITEEVHCGQTGRQGDLEEAAMEEPHESFVEGLTGRIDRHDIADAGLLALQLREKGKNDNRYKELASNIEEVREFVGMNERQQAPVDEIRQTKVPKEISPDLYDLRNAPRIFIELKGKPSQEFIDLKETLRLWKFGKNYSAQRNCLREFWNLVVTNKDVTEGERYVAKFLSNYEKTFDEKYTMNVPDGNNKDKVCYSMIASFLNMANIYGYETTAAFLGRCCNLAQSSMDISVDFWDGIQEQGIYGSLILMEMGFDTIIDGNFASDTERTCAIKGKEALTSFSAPQMARSAGAKYMEKIQEESDLYRDKHSKSSLDKTMDTINTNISGGLKLLGFRGHRR
jgi:hypothetical protein